MPRQPPLPRAAILDALVAFAKTHPAVTAAAKVGSTAEGFRDEHSDIDLAVAVGAGYTLESFLDDAAAWLTEPAYGFAMLLDLPYRDAVYRVFLRADGLQLDLSARPAASFAPTTPRFELCFGESRPLAPKAQPDGGEQLREAVLYLRLADVALRRERPRQAQYFLDRVRERVQTALCLDHGLNPFDGRGFDDLPAEVTARTATGCSYGLERERLRAAVKVWARETARVSGRAGVGRGVRAYLRALATE